MTDASSKAVESRPAWRTAVSLLLLLASVAIWIPASDVPKLVIEQDAVLLGRYSKEQFSVLFFATPGLWLAAWLFWRDRWATREAKFKAVALTLGIIIAIVAVDVVGRAIRTPRYVEESVQEWSRWPGERVDGPVRSRPPDMTYHVTYADVPPQSRSYPNAPSGFGTVEVTLTTDSRGFRNAEALDRADVVVIGDSFTEGSRVDDDESWPVLVGKHLDHSVYCLGISGGTPGSYLSNFMAYGRQLRPRVAVFMLYDGNDFVSVSKSRERSVHDRINDLVKSSPIIDGLRSAFVRWFGPVNADGAVEHEALEWMPAEIRTREGSLYCAFMPKRLLRLMWEREEFEQSRSWKHTSAALGQALDACREAGVQPVVALAPSAPHVVMPLIRDEITPRQLRAFLSVSEDDLPPAEECFDAVYDGLDVIEQMLAEYCAEQDVPFISVTAALQERMRAGEQVYYTYDQHWTRLGHEAVAEMIAPVVAEMLTDRQ